MKNKFHYPRYGKNSGFRIQDSGFWVQESGDRSQPGPAGTPRPTFKSQSTDACGRACRAGFTLIEVLASMAVLVLLVLVLTRMFMAGANISKHGTTMLMRNSTGATVLETLLADVEGMVVNERLACYVEADVTDQHGFGFDDVWFISTSGDQDDEFPYEYFHYFVTNTIVTNQLGAPYVRFDLMKDRMIFAVGDNVKVPFYALDINDAQWWKKAKLNPQSGFGPWDRQVMADNVIRFDIYCTGWDGKGWMGGYSGVHEFDSTRGPNGGDPKNVPPAGFDFYLQITSPEAAVEGGMALLPGVPLDVQTKGRELMIQESASFFGRAVPLIGAARYNTVEKYGTNNTAYYEN